MGADRFGDPLERILVRGTAAEQPPLLPRRPRVLSAVLGSLAVGGAERIVLDWAGRTVARPSGAVTVRLAILKDVEPEWPVPAGVELVRFRGEALDEQLASFGARAAGDGSPVVCHLLTAAHRLALRAGGATTVTVLHNASEGWLESAAAIADEPYALAVSRAAADEYRAHGGRIPCKVLRHFPHGRAFAPGERERWRERWAIPQGAWVIGMAGGIKPQKAYTRAVRILREIIDRQQSDPEAPPVVLVVLGGPVGRDGALAWNAVLAQAHRLGVVDCLRMPGFVQEAAAAFCAFDVFLNTSRYEGLSIATLEALAAGLPVVASRVGGQGEVGAHGYALLDADAPDAEWAEALLASACIRRAVRPDWAGFPSERLWNMAHLVRPFRAQRGRVLFVTANLNAGGAQRSLVNLALSLQGRVAFEIAVTGNSTNSAFGRRLGAAGIALFRSDAGRDCLDHAEALIEHICDSGPGIVCFWNVDAKIKLLLVKWLAHRTLKFIEVSPGDYLFEEMAATRRFQECIAFDDAEYYARLDHLVQKFRAPAFAPMAGRTTVIANGVHRPEATRAPGADRSKRFALCGRIAPSKFVLEAIEAVRLLRQEWRDLELHLLGTAEPREREYALRVAAAAGAQPWVVFHGPSPDAPERLCDFDALIVLGRHQGCPNAVLEALAAGVSVVANDSGGTRELVIDGRTGLLVDGVEPHRIAGALRRLLSEPLLAGSLSARGREHAQDHFSMPRMRDRYLRLFRAVEDSPGRQACW